MTQNRYKACQEVLRRGRELAFFLAKDAFGHDDGNRDIFAGYFC